ncbi:MAG TPA: hypothetical protein VFI62_00420, partial [Burkholderiales bacterium]|nr:hypothetical protein [Burkholderiales bacterium]
LQAALHRFLISEAGCAMTFYLITLLLSAAIIVAVSEVAKRSGSLGALILSPIAAAHLRPRHGVVVCGDA